MEFDDINDLLASVLNDDTVPEETPTPKPLPPQPEESCESANESGTPEVASETADASESISEDAGTTTTPTTEAEPLSTPDDEPDDGEEEVDDIEAMIAAATAEVEGTNEPDEPDGPDVSDGTDAEGFPGGDERMDVTPSVSSSSSKVFSTGVGDESIPIPTFTDEDVMDQIDIRNFGTLVTLRTQRWHGKIKDKKAAKDAALASNADAAAFEAQKHLLAGADTLLKAVHKAIDGARTAHYSLTLPWSTVGVNETGKRQGARLLPNTLFMEYTAAVANAKQETEDAINAFEAEYPNLITQAAAKLGSAFNQTEYPPVSSIREHFGLEFDFMPIPKGADFDSMQGQMATKLAESLNARTRIMLENAMADAWTRLFETVQHAHAKLSNPDATFHYTLVDKLREQAAMLKHLNATGDQKIEDIRIGIEDKLTKHDVKDIRKDDALRKRLAGHAGELVEAMKEYANENS